MMIITCHVIMIRVIVLLVIVVTMSMMTITGHVIMLLVIVLLMTVVTMSMIAGALLVTMIVSVRIIIVGFFRLDLVLLELIAKAGDVSSQDNCMGRGTRKKDYQSST